MWSRLPVILRARIVRSKQIRRTQTGISLARWLVAKLFQTTIIVKTLTEYSYITVNSYSTAITINPDMNVDWLTIPKLPIRTTRFYITLPYLSWVHPLLYINRCNLSNRHPFITINLWYWVIISPVSDSKERIIYGDMTRSLCSKWG